MEHAIARELMEAASGGCTVEGPLTPWELVLRVSLGVVCLLLAALFSGLTLGIMGLDVSDLEIMKSGGSEEEKRDATLIAPVRAKGNLLLCTLVLGNVAVTSLESILLAGLTDGFTGFLLSTVLVVVFGEIVPQAICARYAMRIGAKALPILNVFLFLFYPFAKPLSMVLDAVLGEEEGMSYNRAKLKKLVAMHLDSKQLAASEAAIITNALAYRSKTVAQACTPASDMFTLRASDRLNQELMTAIFEMGYSRIPVLDAMGERVVGVLHAKDLVLIHPSDCQPVISVVHFFGRQAFNTVANTELLEDVMRLFTTSKQPFAMVRSATGSSGSVTTALAGLITMQDILREIIGEDIDKAQGEVQGVGLGGKARMHAMASAAVEASAVAQAALRLDLHSHHHPGFSAAQDLAAVSNGLSAQQVRAMAAHLHTNVEAFRRLSCGLEAVAAMLTACPVRDFVGPGVGGAGGQLLAGAAGAAAAEAGEGVDALPRMLYERGRLTDWCCVILTGSVQVTSGDDAVVSSAGPWDVLAERVLLLEAHSAPAYRVDFDARPASRIVHALCIPRAAYNALLGGGERRGAAPGPALAQQSPAASSALSTLLPPRGLNTRGLRSPSASALGSPSVLPPAAALGSPRQGAAPGAVFVPVSAREFDLECHPCGGRQSP